MYKIFTLFIFFISSSHTYAQVSDACRTGGGSACGTGGSNRGTLTAPTFTWQRALFSGSNTNYFVVSLTAGQRFQFATCSGQDLEVTVYHEDGSNRVEFDQDDDCANCTSLPTSCTPNGNDESGIYVAAKNGNHRIRLSNDGFWGNCADIDNNSGMYLYYRLEAPCTGVTPTYGSGVWNSYVYDGNFSTLYGQFTNTATPDVIDRDFGSGTFYGQPITNACGAMCNSDDYRTRWLMTRNYSDGIYVFSTPNNDDGKRLSINGGTSWIINQLGTGGTHTSSPVALNGSTNVIFDQQEDGGGSRASLSTCQMGGGNTNVYGTAGSAWNVYVYDASNYTFATSTYRGTFTRGTSSATSADLPSFSNTDAQNNRTGTCGTTCGANNSVRALLNNNFTSGLYKVTIGNDDNFRISFDGGSTFPFDYGCCGDQDNYRFLCGSTNIVYQGNNTGGGGTYKASISASGPLATAITSSTCALSGYRANWVSVSNATGYYIDISSSSSFAPLLISNQYTTNNYYDIDLTPGTTYYYRVRAYISNCNGSAVTSVNSNTITANIPALSNDYIANATNMGNLNLSQNTQTFDLTAENNIGSWYETSEPWINQSDEDKRTDWYSFTTGNNPPRRVEIGVEENGSDIDADFKLYKLINTSNPTTYNFPRCGVDFSKLQDWGDGDGGDNVIVTCVDVSSYNSYNT